MNTLLRTLIISVTVLLCACSSNSDQVTTKEKMSKIPKELRVFDGFKESLNKAGKATGDLEARLKEQQALLDNI